MGEYSPSTWVKKLHTNLEPGTLKHNVGEFLESRKVEVLIIILVLCDVLLLGVEHGIDRHMLCIDGAVTPVAPNDLVALGKEHSEGHGHGHFLQEWPAISFPWTAGAGHLRSGYSTNLGRDSDSDRDSLFLTTETANNAFAQGWMFMQEDAAPIVVRPQVAPHVKSSDSSHIKQVGAPYRVKERVGPPGAEPKAIHSAAKAPAQAAESAHEAAHDVEQEGRGHGEEHHAHAAEHGAHGAEAHEAREEHHGGHGHHEAALVCETRHGPQSHQIEHTCHQASILILSIFLVEILGKLWVNTHEFIRSPVEMLDLVVVSVSLIVDVIVIPMIQDPETRSEAELVVALLIVCRAWRIVRIFHGAFEVVHHQIEHEEKLNERIHELEDALRRIRPSSPVLSQKRRASIEAQKAKEELEQDERMMDDRTGARV